MTKAQVKLIKAAAKDNAYAGAQWRDRLDAWISCNLAWEFAIFMGSITQVTAKQYHAIKRLTETRH